MDTDSALALRHWEEGCGAALVGRRRARRLWRMGAEPCSAFSPALALQFALPADTDESARAGDEWLDADCALNWTRLEADLPADAGVALRRLQHNSGSAHRRLAHCAVLPLLSSALCCLDLYENGAPERAWAAHVAGSSAAAGALLVSLFEQYVKLCVRGAHWAGLAARAPNKLSLLCADERFQAHFAPGLRYWFERLLGGPPNLNVRNYLWHGFVGDDYEAPYTTLLFVFAASWVRRTGGWGAVSPAVVRMAAVDQHERAHRGHTALPYVAPLPADALSGAQSFFVIPGRRAMTRWMVRHYESGDTDLWLCALLPLLEHSLRRAWVATRVASQRGGKTESEALRLLTCEDDTLMTTMDTFLSEDAQLDAALGCDAMLHARDLFVHEGGPRLRDLCSHGATDAYRLPPALRNSVALLWHRMLARCPLVAPQFFFPPPPHAVAFHPSAILRARMLRARAFVDALPRGPDDAPLVRAAAALQQRWQWRADGSEEEEEENGAVLFRFAPPLLGPHCDALQRQVAAVLQGVLQCAVLVLRRGPSHGRGALAATLSAVVAAMGHCCGPAAPHERLAQEKLDWLQCARNVVGRACVRAQENKSALLRVQLAVWLRVEGADGARALSHRERDLLAAGLHSLPADE